MKRTTCRLAVLGALALAAGGCVTYSGPFQGALFTNVKTPVGAGDSVGDTRMGKASVTGILGVALGDASIKTAASNGGISKIHHVDSETFSILGVYVKTTTVVYGE